MNQRVMIVDDSAAMIRQISKLLDEIGGYEVVGTARNGNDALRLYKDVTPDVVLMDIVMPSMGGMECLRMLINIDPDAKVLLVSSVGDVRRNIDEGLRLGARGIINKPFEPEQVRVALDTLFGAE